jgi:hypothetical protein
MKSESIKELSGALAKAQAEMESARLSSSNPFYKSKYADFGEIVKSSRPALTKHGLAVTQIFKIVEDIVLLETILMHSSGEFISSEIRINPPKTDVQSLGSFITYLKRYSYAAIVGVITEDDDGEESVNETRMGYKQSFQPQEPVISPDQLDELEMELENHADIAVQVLNGLNIKRLADMPKSKFLASIKRIRELVASKG